MAKFPASRKRPEPEGDTMPSNVQRQRSSQMPYLRPADLNATRPTQLVILECRTYTGGKFGHQFMIRVVLENDKEYDWSVRIGGQAHMRLDRAIGKNIFEWKDKVIEVQPASFTKDGKDEPYVEVVEASNGRD